jgi:hypothetical protein
MAEHEAGCKDRIMPAAGETGTGEGLTRHNETMRAGQNCCRVDQAARTSSHQPDAGASTHVVVP